MTLLRNEKFGFAQLAVIDYNYSQVTGSQRKEPVGSDRPAHGSHLYADIGFRCQWLREWRLCGAQLTDLAIERAC